MSDVKQCRACQIGVCSAHRGQDHEIVRAVGEALTAMSDDDTDDTDHATTQPEVWACRECGPSCDGPVCDYTWASQEG